MNPYTPDPNWSPEDQDFYNRAMKLQNFHARYCIDTQPETLVENLALAALGRSLTSFPSFGPEAILDNAILYAYGTIKNITAKELISFESSIKRRIKELIEELQEKRTHE